MGLITYSIPTAGSTLNSIADPELATALQTILTWANGNIDTTNLSAAALAQLGLSYAPISVSTTIAGGQAALAAAGITVTLPGPVAGTMCAVIANTSVTAGGPVTVSGGAAPIFGVGLSLSGATSFPLGMPLASVVLFGDGSAWLMLSGQSDTGWAPLSYATGFSSGAGAGFFVPAYRRVGNTVRLRGGVENTSGSTQNGVVSMCTGAPVPPGVVSFASIIPTVGGATGFQVSTGGVVSQATGYSILNGQIMALDGAEYDLS